MSFYEINTNGLIYMRSTIIGAKHAFTTRFGGVSRGAFASLNLASEKGDDPEAVRENFRRVCALFGTDENGACTARQVHQNQVRVVTSADKHSCLAPAAIEADGLVTAEKGLPVFCFAADCTPMLLWDTENRAVGAIHCSWRNSVMDMPGRAVAAMGTLGAGPEKLCAALGPALGRCHFETDDDVPDAIEAWIGDTAGLFDRRPDGKTMVDLRAAIARRLVQLGVPAENIDVSGECTFCSHDKYWSHRYVKGPRGHQGAVIML